MSTNEKGEKIYKYKPNVLLVRELQVQKCMFSYHIEGQFHFSFILCL
jgi:hypothetical protein